MIIGTVRFTAIGRGNPLITKDTLTQFTLKSPPSDLQLHEIGTYLIERLNMSLYVQFRVTRVFIEPSSAMTITVAREHLLLPFGCLQCDGTVYYALRDGLPVIDSVVRMFLNGKRLRHGRLTVLSSVFDTAAGNWQAFDWTSDVYDEWACDEWPLDVPFHEDLA